MVYLSMLDLIQKHRVFLGTYLFSLCAGLLLKLIYGKEAIFMWVNAHHHPLTDLLFKYLTHLGDGLFFFMVIVALLFVSYRLAAHGLMVYLISSQLAQFLKRVVFPNVPRPSKYFEDLRELHFVDGVTVHKMMSFPSGHATSTFALAFFLAMIISFKNKFANMAWVVLAIIVAYSRIYLAQHFLEDVMVGSLIGVLTAMVSTLWFNKMAFFRKDFFDRSILK
jgi:membrane-associated phospholipid phosphatase